MILLVPLGPGEPTPRTPRVTLALLGLNVLVFVLTVGADTQKAAETEAELSRVAGWTLEIAAQDSPALAARLHGPAAPLRFLEVDTAWRTDVASPELRARLEACLDDSRALRKRHPFYRYGFVPAEIGATRLLAHQFLHADFLHLLFNMIFLWTVGGLVELTLGAVRFAAVFLLGGVAAALTHAALNPGSAEPAIGASGAVAAVMGLCAVLHGRSSIRLALVAMLAVAPRISILAWPAWAFLGLWLAEQLFFASFGSTTLDVAFGAHLGGFAFGVAVAVAYRLLGGRGAGRELRTQPS